jgi:hypothetical protein
VTITLKEIVLFVSTKTTLGSGGMQWKTVTDINAMVAPF